MCLEQELNNINELFYNNSNSYKLIQSHTKELLKVFKKKSLKKFTQQDVEKYLKYLKMQNNSNATINSKLSYLSKCLNYYNNKLKMLYQRVVNKEKEVISFKEFMYILNNINDDYELIQFIKIAYYTGLRANEILNIKLSDISYEHGTYFIKLNNTKNHKPNLIPVSLKLNTIMDCFSEFKMTYRQLHYKLNLLNITAHQFRHSFITRCFESGLDTFTIMKLVNQTSINSTQKYVHLQNKFLNDAINKVTV